MYVRWYAPDSHHLGQSVFSLSTLLLPAGTAGLVERGYASYSSAQTALFMGHIMGFMAAKRQVMACFFVAIHVLGRLA